MWSKLRWSGLDKTVEQKPNLLLSLFLLLGTSITTIQAINNVIRGNYLAIYVDLVIVTVLICCYILNEKSYHKTAKIIFLLFANFSLFVFANIVPKNVGLYFYFFPIISITSVIFTSKDIKLRNALLILPVLQMISLELVKYQAFGKINIMKSDENTSSFMINLVASGIVLVVSIYSMLRINEEIEAKRTKIADDLRLANEDLKKINEELDNFVYSASHDLKAPLLSILGLINLAKYDINDKQQLDYLNMIRDRIEKLNNFIKDIIQYSRNSRLGVVSDSIKIDHLIDTVIENNKYADESKKIAFIKNIKVTTPLRADRTRLEVIMNNLVSNAIKYHDQKQESPVVNITAFRQNGHLVISVRDNGQGIAAEEHDKIFEMFYRGNENSEGSGLGLYIVKDVVDKLQGSIKLTSKENEGTEFKVVIPIEKDENVVMV